MKYVSQLIIRVKYPCVIATCAHQDETQGKFYMTLLPTCNKNHTKVNTNYADKFHLFTIISTSVHARLH